MRYEQNPEKRLLFFNHITHPISGGYNRGRSAAAGIRNAYASDALLCPNGDRRHPKFDHLKILHRLIANSSEVLSNSRSALSNPFPVEVPSIGQNNDSSIWISGAMQRMFNYSGYGEELLFIENDAQIAVKVRVKELEVPPYNMRCCLNLQ